jgi:hypothetical protein
MYVKQTKRMKETDQHQELVTAAEKFTAKVREFLSHKDMQCMAAIAHIHGYVPNLPSLEEEWRKIEESIKASKAKIANDINSIVNMVCSCVDKEIEKNTQSEPNK